MNKLLIILCLIIFLSSCSSASHVTEADRIIDKFSSEMKKEGFILVGSGGAMMDNIKEFHLSYEKINSVDVDQARTILIDKALRLINIINSDVKIRPYLNNYPFNLKNINLDLFFTKEKGGFALAPNIATAFTHTRTGKVVFTADNPAKILLKIVHEETFEEALEIYNNTKNLNSQ